MAHREKMRIVNFIGACVLALVTTLCVSVIGLVWDAISHGKSVESATGQMLGLAGLVTTLCAYLVPSPLQQQQGQRRASDAQTPAGTPDDPISTDNVDVPNPPADKESN